MSEGTTVHVRGASRPLGVWLLTGYAFLFSGLVPLVFALGLAGIASSEFGGGIVELVLSAVLSLGVAVSAAGAWRGLRSAKNMMIWLVTLHYVAIALNNLVFLVAGEAEAGSPAQMAGRVLRGVLYPAIYVWYFRRSGPREFYGES